MLEHIDPGRTWRIMRRYSTEDAEDVDMERLATGRMEEVIGDLVNACAVTPGRLLYIIYSMVKWQSHRRA